MLCHKADFSELVDFLDIQGSHRTVMQTVRNIINNSETWAGAILLLNGYFHFDTMSEFC